MNPLYDVARILAFRSSSLHAQAGRHAIVSGVVWLAAGFLTFVLIRNAVYRDLLEVSPDTGWFGSFLRLGLIQVMIFFSLIYVPLLICLCNAISGDGLGFSFSRKEYRNHVSSLFPLWGALFLLSGCIQWFLPEFLVLGVFSASLGILVLMASMAVYTCWAIKELNYISPIAALSAVLLSLLSLPLFYLLIGFIFALPLFLLIPLGYLAYRRYGGFLSARHSERGYRQQLENLTLNPRDADAHYQLGLHHFERGNHQAAQNYFSKALEIEPADPDYHYSQGRLFEAKEDWTQSLEHYEEVYKLNPEHRLGDILREVGKGYLHTREPEKALEFLRYFLKSRGFDPEGRYWLAVALERTGDREGMRVHLSTLLDQARSNPRFFRKENREWLYRTRVLLRNS